jgi:hypothetical protein
MAEYYDEERRLRLAVLVGLYSASYYHEGGNLHHGGCLQPNRGDWTRGWDNDDHRPHAKQTDRHHGGTVDEWPRSN